MLDLIEMRNQDFLNCCRRVADSSPKPIKTADIALKAAQCKPRGYYLTCDYAVKRLRMRRASHRRQPDTGSGRRWAELDSRVAARQQRRGLSLSRAVADELRESAPTSFHMSPTYAVRLYQRLRQDGSNCL